MALMLGGSLLLGGPWSAMAADVAAPTTASAEQHAPATVGPPASSADAAGKAGPEAPSAMARGEMGRSTATAGDPYGNLVPVRTMPKVHPVEPSSSGAFSAPDPAIDGKPATFEHSALAVPRGFELRPPIDRAFKPSSVAEPSSAAVPSLAALPGPASLASTPGGTGPATDQGSAPPTAEIAPVPAAVAIPKGIDADTAKAAPDREAAAMPVAPAAPATPVQTLTPAPPASEPPVPASPGAPRAEPAVVPPASATAAPAATPPRGIVRERTHPAAAARPVHRPADRPARIEKARRDTARARPSRRGAEERYDDLPELMPLPPGVLPQR